MRNWFVSPSRLASLAVCAIACSGSRDASEGETSGTRHPEGGAGSSGVTADAQSGSDAGVHRATAGYVEVPEQHPGATNRARMFYSLRLADESPGDKPLLVLFNGGPSVATSVGLMTFNTGPFTTIVDPSDLTAIGSPGPNPDSWTRFANLLYIDERNSGFSYGLGPLGCDGNVDPLADAGDFIYALLDVLDTYPALTSTDVVLVGESYGGMRSALMLYAMHNYAAPPRADWLPDVQFGLPWLRERLQAHLDLAFSERAGRVWQPDEVADQFGTQVLIQPGIGGSYQLQFGEAAIAGDPDFADFVASSADSSLIEMYDVRLTSDVLPRQYESAISFLRDPDWFSALVGVEPESVRGLPAAERGASQRILDGQGEVALAERRLRERLGALGPEDAYWLYQVVGCGQPRNVGYAAEGLEAFADVVQRTRTLITNARWDAVVYTEALPAFLESLGLQAYVDMARPAGARRPGLLVVGGLGVDPVEIRFPTYESGHEVTLTAGRELGEDIVDWLASPGPGQ
jgi:hypothetical protein